MSTPLSVLAAELTWASDEDYPAGADPWSGTPTKVAPTTQSKETGFTPEEPMSAEQENYVLHGVCEVSKYLMDRFQNLPVLNFRPASTAVASFAHAAWDPINGHWLAASAAGTKVVRKSDDLGVTWSANEISALGGTPTCFRVAVSTVDGSAVVTTDAREVYERSSGGTWTRRSTAMPLAPDAGSFYEVVHNPISGGWIGFTAGATVLVFATSPDRAVWTSQTMTTAGVGNAQAAIAIDPVAGRVVVAQIPLPLASGNVETHTSATDGADFPVAAVVVNHGYTASVRLSLAWDARAELFVMVVCSLGVGTKVYTSPDASAWTLVETLASGHALLRVCIVGEVWATIKYSSGVAFSLDQGATWRNAQYNAEVFNHMSSSGNQFLLVGSGNVHAGLRSGPGGEVLT